MKRGPKPTPTSILKLRGSWRGKARHDEPVLKPVRLTPPSWLPAAGKRLFNELAAVLGASGITTKADRLGLALLCDCYARYRAAGDIILREGAIVKTNAGGKKPHPAVQMRNVAHDQLVKSLAAFGLTPADRARVTVVDPSGGDDLTRLIDEAVAAEAKERRA